MAQVYASPRMWVVSDADRAQGLNEYTCTQSEANASYIYAYFKAKGWTDIAVAGLVGNCTYESYTNPAFHEVGGAGFGIVQWTPSSNYINWARPRGFPVDSDVSDPERYLLGQCERINYELQTNIEFFGNSSYGANFHWCNTWQKYISLTESQATPQTAAHIFLSNYERPNHSAAAASLSARQAYAKRWYDKFKDGKSSSHPSQTTAAHAASEWMKQIAEDDSHGYDQQYRWGERGDYDCSALVITAYDTVKPELALKANGATYTGDMMPVMIRRGFQNVSSEINFATGSGLREGDVLLNTAHHAAMYVGDGQMVESRINEKNTVTGGQVGDQTHHELHIRQYYNYPFHYALRYDGMTTFGGGGSAVGVSIIRAVPVTKEDWTKNPERNG